MKITTIRVNAGRTFNNPYESYANLRPEVTLTANLEGGEDPIAATRKLQAQCETLVEQHKARLLSDLDKMQTYTTRTRDIARLEQQIETATDHLKNLKAEAEKDGPLQLSIITDDII